MTRDGELKARDFVALVAGGAGRDSVTGVVQRLLQAHTAVASNTQPSWATEAGWPLLAYALLAMARSDEPSSDAPNWSRSTHSPTVCWTSPNWTWWPAGWPTLTCRTG